MVSDKKICPFGGAKVFDRGDVKSPLVIVGEAPGVEEVKEGKPFVGPSGDILWGAYGSTEGCEPYVINAYRCRYRKRAAKRLLAQARECCMDVMWKAIEKYPRKLIIVLGNEALASILGWPVDKVKITKMQGKVIKVKGYDIFPVIHPAAILRGSGSLTQFRELIQKGKRIVFGGSEGYKLPDYHVVVNREGIPTKIAESNLLALDIETTGLNYLKDDILCIGLSNGKDTIVIPWSDLAKDFLNGSKARWILHNGQFDIKFLRVHDVNVSVDEDTMLMSYAMDERQGYHDLGYLGNLYVGAEDFKQILDEYLPNKKASYGIIPKDVLYKYQAADADVTYKLYWKLWEKLQKDPDLVKLYKEHLIPATNMLAWVESNGLFVWQDQRAKMEVALQGELNKALQEIWELAGYRVNPNSPMQVKKMLADVFGIKLQDTRKETFDKLAGIPIVNALRRYRKAAKLYNTYVKPLSEITQADGRVHPSFKLHGTVTGRLASANPNVQNIPRDADIRAMYGCHPDNWLLEVDLSQAELRVLAILSGDEGLIRIYREGLSLHKEVARAQYGPNYTGDQYVRAKAVNFGIVYGRTAYTLSKEFDIPLSEGQRMIDVWFERFPKAYEFLQRLRRSPIEKGVIVTPFGRKRRFQAVTAARLEQLQNEACNFPHQSIASDIVIASAVRLMPQFKKLGCKIINLVHDSMLVEIPNKEMAKDVYQMVRDTYIAVGIEKLGDAVLFESDCKFGKQWGYANELS